MESDEALTYKLWRIRKTVMQLCHDRGYLVSQEEIDQSFDIFKEQYGDRPSEGRPSRSDLIVLVAHIDDPTGKLYPMLLSTLVFKTFFVYRSDVCLFPWWT